MFAGGNAAVDGGHGPAGEGVEALPVAAEDELAHGVEQRGGEEGSGARGVGELGEHGVCKAGLGGELAHHLREGDGVGRETSGTKGVTRADRWKQKEECGSVEIGFFHLW